MAVENFKNGHPLTGAVVTIDAAAELTYNAVASYGVASQLSKSLPAATAFVQTKAGELRVFIQSGAVQQTVRGWFGKRGLTASQQKAIRTLEKRIAEHKEKLNTFKKNPTVRPGMENMSKKVIEKQQRSRIEHLEKEIKTFKDNIGKILRGK